MSLRVIWVLGFILSVTACAEKEQAMSEPADEAAIAALETVAPTAGDENWQNDDFLGHMHLHAEKLDDLNFALADGDLKASKMPARWLSRHDTNLDIQSDWMPFVYGMRVEAEAVEAATDLATARAAAERISDQCQSCHAAAGVSIP